MTHSLIKIIALFTMLIDHTGHAFGEILGLISYKSTYLMRSIGRISFILFSFNLVEGYKHTSSKTKYLERMLVFALISQVPFSLFAIRENYSYPLMAINDFLPTSLEVASPLIIFLGLLLSLSHFLVYGKKEMNLSIYLFLASFLASLSLRTKIGIYILNPKDLSVFYTLAASFYIIRELDLIKKSLRENFNYTKIFRLLNIFLLGKIFLSQSDYGFRGLFLILIFFVFKSPKSMVQIIIKNLLVVYWAFKMYRVGFPDWTMFMISLLSLVFINLYKGKKGYSNKTLQIMSFYFYPAHLLIIALISFSYLYLNN